MPKFLELSAHAEIDLSQLLGARAPAALTIPQETEQSDASDNEDTATT